jgi:hypothetical protein
MTPPAAALRVGCREPIATGYRQTPQVKNMLRRYRQWTLTRMVVITHDR